MATAERANEVRRDPDAYTGPEKAAIVILSLGDHANALMALLDEEEIRQVSQMMSSLGVVPQGVVEAIVTEFFERFSTVGTLMGSYEQTRRMLTGIMTKERVDALMEELHGPAGRSVWEKLANVNEAVLSGYLAHEYPQTVAVVLTKVRPDYAARVLSELPEDFAGEVVQRMLNTESVHRDVLQQIEDTLRVEFISNLNRAARRDSHELMAEIFNHFDRQTETRFLTGMENKTPESADKIKALMFVFEDLSGLDTSGVQTLMRSADKADLALALKGASDTLRTLFFSNMSERGAKLLREDMAGLGPVRLRDVDAAQARIVAMAKDLAARGEIILSDGKSEDEMIY